MWNKQQIRNLNQKANAYCGDDYVRDHLDALNFHLNNYEMLTLPQKRIEQWKEVECEADHIRDRFFQILERDALRGHS